jgi:hypothetical protein
MRLYLEFQDNVITLLRNVNFSSYLDLYRVLNGDNPILTSHTVPAKFPLSQANQA